jgi:hypothetical protein
MPMIGLLFMKQARIYHKELTLKVSVNIHKVGCRNLRGIML